MSTWAKMQDATEKTIQRDIADMKDTSTGTNIICFLPLLQKMQRTATSFLYQVGFKINAFFPEWAPAQFSR